VIHDGHMLSPPYEVTVGSAENDLWLVAVNGVMVKRLGGRPKSTPSKVPDLPASGQFDNEDDLARYLTFRLYPALVSEMEPEEAHQQLVRFVQTQDIIEKIVDPEDPYILVKYRHRPDPEMLMPLNYRVPSAKTPAYSASDQAEAAARGLERSLGTGRVVIIAAGGQMSGGGGFALELQRCLATARNLPLLQAECVIRELLIGHEVARRLAVNLTPYYGELDVRLGALAPVRQAGSPPPPPLDKALDALAVDMLEE
ncbi:MAG: hypothetical protein JXR94_05355, partial [Candidatus Hydrogenedentes bacterium]|nr:hypothetical protein [Candidatus Hydrogenedentota bacterium]